MRSWQYKPEVEKRVGSVDPNVREEAKKFLKAFKEAAGGDIAETPTPNE
jgi:hypothetical protein